MSDARTYVVGSGASGHIRFPLRYVILHRFYPCLNCHDHQIILGSTVLRSPSVSMAASALTELDLVIDIFEKGSAHSMRARQGLVGINCIR